VKINFFRLPGKTLVAIILLQLCRSQQQPKRILRAHLSMFLNFKCPCLIPAPAIDHDELRPWQMRHRVREAAAKRVHLGCDNHWSMQIVQHLMVETEAEASTLQISCRRIMRLAVASEAGAKYYKTGDWSRH